MGKTLVVRTLFFFFYVCLPLMAPCLFSSPISTGGTGVLVGNWWGGRQGHNRGRGRCRGVREGGGGGGRYWEIFKTYKIIILRFSVNHLSFIVFLLYFKYPQINPGIIIVITPYLLITNKKKKCDIFFKRKIYSFSCPVVEECLSCLCRTLSWTVLLV